MHYSWAVGYCNPSQLNIPLEKLQTIVQTAFATCRFQAAQSIHKYSCTRVLDPQDASCGTLSEGFPRAPWSARFFLEASIPKDGTHPSGAGPDRRDRSGEREITRP